MKGYYYYTKIALLAPEQQLELRKKWRVEGKKRRALNGVKYRATKRKIQWKFREHWRRLVLEVLGNQCLRCGFNDPRALQVDHINGGGRGIRRKNHNSGTYNKKLHEEIINGSKDYQLLCSNCNWIKRCEKNEMTPRRYEEFEKNS